MVFLPHNVEGGQPTISNSKKGQYGIDLRHQREPSFELFLTEFFCLVDKQTSGGFVVFSGHDDVSKKIPRKTK